nr:uncharacterized protein LOC129447505 [Misgurnus anguillicaudatus]
MAERLIPFIKKQTIFMNLLDKLKEKTHTRVSFYFEWKQVANPSLERRDPVLRCPKKSKLRTVLIQSLFEHLSVRTMYPSHQQYVESLSALITAFPCLKENFGSGYDGLLESLKNKFKKERLPLIYNEEVEKMKAKFGVPGCGRKRAPETVSCHTITRRRTEEEYDAENEMNIMQDVNAMAEEIQKSRPDMALLEKMLLSTKAYRRTYITSHSTRDILQEFPCLKMPRMLLLEMKDISRVDVDKQVTTVLNKMAPAILEKLPLLATHSELAKQCNEKIMDYNEGPVKRGLQLEAAVLCIPGLFNEDSSFLFSTKQTDNVTPYILISCREGQPLSHTSIKIVMDSETIVEDCADISLALSLLFCTYFVFGIEYPERLCFSLRDLSLR